MKKENLIWFVPIYLDISCYSDQGPPRILEK